MEKMMIDKAGIFLTIGTTYSDALERLIDQLTGEQPSDYFILSLEILLGIAYLVGTIYIFKYIISELKTNIGGMFGKLFRKDKKDTANDSKELIIQVLKNMGCPIISKDSTIKFKYSGKEFIANPFHPSFIWVFGHLGYINLTDSEEEIQMLKEAVNDLNQECYFPSYTYEENKEKNTLAVYGGISSLFRKEIPNLENLLGSYLDSIIRAKTEVADKFHLIKEQQEKQKRIVVKGFSTDLAKEADAEQEKQE